MYLGVRPSAELFLLGAPLEETLVVLEGARREAFGPLCDRDRVALRRLAKGVSVAHDAPVTRWLLLTGFAEPRSQREGGPESWQERWSRQLSAYAVFAGIQGSRVVHGRVVSAHIIVVGLGGIGSHVVQHLVSIGVRRFTLIDSDVVEISNLNRQVLYGLADVGDKKVVAAERFIRERAPDPSVLVHRIDGDFLSWKPAPCELQTASLAVVSADSHPASIRRHASALFYPLGIPYGFVSYSGAHGKVGPLVFRCGDGCGSCDVLRVPMDGALSPLAGPGLPRIPPSSSSTNALLSSIFVDRWLHSLAEEVSAPRTIHVDLYSLSMAERQHTRLPSCPVCKGAS